MTDSSIITDPSQHSDFLRAMEYIMLREIGPKKSLDDIAAHFDMARNTLNGLIVQWENDGLLAKCRQQYLFPALFEEVNFAITEAISAYPDVIRRQIRIAKDSKSDYNATQAATWLHNFVIQPVIDKQQKPSTEEFDFIQGIMDNGSANPLDIIELPSGEEELSDLSDPEE